MIGLLTTDDLLLVIDSAILAAAIWIVWYFILRPIKQKQNPKT